MEAIVDKAWIEKQLETLPLWQQSAYISFASMIADDDNKYPCIPGKQGYVSNHLRFSFASDPRELHTATLVAKALKEYGVCSRDAGKYTSLAIFFETPEYMIETYGVEEYRMLFWSVLNQISSLDEKEWPEHMPTDPSNHHWEFCFQGEPYFAFCATPAHQFRKSRYFSTFLIAFQPRWVFDEINDSTSSGRNMKNLIRQRLLEYDNVPEHPDLKWYGQKDNYEWKQYFLSDDESSASSCPFLRMNPRN